MNITHFGQSAIPVEIVERKGFGHPDTLSDRLAEQLSVDYSNYTYQKYGAILHHNFDKVGMMGGKSRVAFGGGEIEEPIRILLNGRASTTFGNDFIDVRELLEDTTRRFIADNLPHVDPQKDVRILFEVATGSSPGAVGENSGYRNRWFAPKSLADLSELTQCNCNDTSLGTAFYNQRPLEHCVYHIETQLNSEAFRSMHPWIGSDIKIMGFRQGNHKICITMAIPQIAAETSTLEQYWHNKEYLNYYVSNMLRALYPEIAFETFINTRDKLDSENMDLYLTVTGSSIEMGDEGFVGRGNRIGGLITPFRPYSMEGICGKNPVYHTGKMYSVAAYEISRLLWERHHVDANILLIGQSGQPLQDPWQVVVTGGTLNDRMIRDATEAVLSKFDTLTHNILSMQYPMC
jgi:S-adenosylmethionine synthetase